MDTPNVIGIFATVLLVAIFVTFCGFAVWAAVRWVKSQTAPKQMDERQYQDLSATIREGIKAEVAKATTTNAAGTK